jgi:tetratricopeptide (TPR) repeat protein
MKRRDPIRLNISGRARASVWSVVAIASLGFLFGSPTSPLALSIADAEFGRGAHLQALAHYDEIAQKTLSATDRDLSLERAAMLYSSELRDVDTAITRLKRLTEITDSPATRTRAYVSMGRLLLEAGAEDQAAIAFKQGYTSGPTSKEGLNSLALAARAYMEAGQLPDAVEAWKMLTSLEVEVTYEAQLGLAETHIALGNVELALPIYRSITQMNHVSEDVAVTAQLGIATCLDRMGNFNEAVAELDEADLPGDVFQTRSELILARPHDRLQ